MEDTLGAGQVQVRSLCGLSDGAGGVAVVGGEAAGEVGGAFVAEFVGDGFDLDAGLAEEDEGLGHF